MRKVLGSITLLVLVFNTLLTPLTYAEEYEEIIETSSENTAEEVVEETGEEESSSEFSVEEENTDEEKEEEIEEEIETEETEDGETITGDTAEEGTGDTEEIEVSETEGLTGDNEDLTGEVEILTGDIVEEFTGDTEELTGDTEELTGGVVNDEIGTGDIEEIVYNKESIIGERTYDDVTVKVEALSGIFPEGTELKIEPIKWWNLSNLKDKLVEEQSEVKEDTTVVAFDITFIYSGEEVQPKEGEKVKVTFDYSNNEDLVEVDKQENQEVKVYHIEDKDEEGNELEKEEQKIIDVTNKEESEEEGIVVAEGESFSVYALIIIESNSSIITLDGKGGTLDDSTNITDIICDDQTGLCTGNIALEGGYIRFPSAKRENAYFLGWIGSGTDAGLSTLTKSPVLPVATVIGHAYKAKYTCDYGYVDENDVCISLADASSTGLVYDSESQTITVWGNVDGIKMRYTIQDRNVGASLTGIGNVLNNKQKAGKYFQWGNNYGIYKDEQGFSSINNAVPILDVDSSTYAGPLVEWNTEKNHPNSAYYGNTNLINNLRGGNSYIGDWDSSRGPCPVGYHVPSEVEMNNIIEIGTKILGYDSIGKNNDRISALANLLYLPFAGWGTPSLTSFANDKSHTAQYWLRNSIDGVHPSYVEMNIHSSNQTYRGIYVQDQQVDRPSRRMLPVRCFQDYANCPEGYEKEGLNCIKPFTIEFDTVTNGGTGYIDPIDGNYKKVVLDLTQYTAQKTGYYFVGWNTNKNAIRGLQGSQTIRRDTTLYAIYLKLFTYTFVDEGGDILGTGYYQSGVVSDMTKLIPLDYYLNAVEETIQYQDLLTLGITEQGKGRSWNPELPKDGIATGDLLLTGEISNKYTVTFLDANNDTYLEYKVAEGNKIKEPDEHPEKTDSVFVGWYEDSEGTSGFDFSTKEITGDIIIYSIFRESPCIFSTKSENGGITINGFNGTQSEECLTHFMIPSEISGKKVLKIAGSAFKGTATNAQIISGEIILPNTITYIGDYAFQSNKISGKLRLPKNITFIGNSAFSTNQISGELEFPDSLTTILAGAFHFNKISGTLRIPGRINAGQVSTQFRCNPIEEVIFGEGILSIGTEAFYTASSVCPKIDVSTIKTIRSVQFPSTLNSIEKNAFNGQVIESLNLKDTLNTIGDAAFAWNRISGTLYIPGTINNGVVNTAFRHNYIEKVIFGTGITRIADNAFSAEGQSETLRKQIKYVEFPETLTSIGNNAFRSQIIVELSIPNSVETIGDYAFYGNQISGMLELPSSLTTLGDYAFKSNKISGTLYIPGTINNGVVNEAFRYNYIEKVIFGNGITQINNHAFSTDGTSDSLRKQIKYVEFPETLTGIGNYAFYKQSITGELKLPESLITIGLSAFRENKIDSLKISSSSVETVGDYAFYGNQISGTLELPSSLKTVKKYAFDYQYKNGYTLKSVVLHGGENIEYRAFATNDIKSVYIPDSIVDLSGQAFDQLASNKNTYVIGYVTTKKPTLNYTGAFIKPVYQLYTYTFVDTGGHILGTGYYPEILESNTTKLIPLNYYNGIGNINDFTGVDSLIPYDHQSQNLIWSIPLSENSIVTENLIVTGIVEDMQNYKVTYDSITNGGSKEQQIEGVEYGAHPSLSLYTGYKEGWTFVGWNINSGAKEGLASNEITITSDIILYAIYRKEAKILGIVSYPLNGDGITYNEGHDYGFTCTLPEVFNNEEQDTSCTVSMPFVTINDWSRREFIGVNSDSGATENASNIVWETYDYEISGFKTPVYSGTITLTEETSGKKWYIISKYPSITLTGNFQGNGSTILGETSTGCTIGEIYNKAQEITSCEVDMPRVTPNTNTPTFVGWNTNSGATENDGVSYNNITNKLTLSLANGEEQDWYAITKSSEKRYTATYVTDNRVEENITEPAYCDIAETYNGEAQGEECPIPIVLPTLTAKVGYHSPIWKLGTVEYEGGTSLYLSGNVNLTGTATPDEQTPYVVKHYYQTLTNTNEYQLSGEDNLSGETESVLTLSQLQKEASSIPGFTYRQARVNGEVATIIDVTDIHDFDTQAEIQSGLVIQLFYTRKNNPVILHQIGNATVEKTPSKDSYYYGETITFSGHADAGYTFSGWDIREGGAETGRREGTRIEYTMINTGVEVTPVIREHKYTIHYNASGAVGTIADSVVSYSENVTLPTAEEVATQYTYTGHHFVGWTTGEAVIATLTKATPEDNGEVTLNAKWEENDGVAYSVEYYLEPVQEGSAREQYILQSGDTYHGTAPQGTTVTGALNNYPGFTSPEVQEVQVVTEGTTIKYYYTRNSYDYTFAAGEGAKYEDGTTSKTVSFRYEQPVVFTETIIKTGYTQNGWNPELASIMPNENKTTTAEWTENQYTINYNANGGTGETPTQKVRYTEEVALTGNAFIKTGYTFTGWSETAEGSVVYKDKAQVSKLTGANNAIVTLYAQWSADSYIVTFDANSGDVAYLTKKVTYDSTYGTLPIATRTGYDFKGWYTAKVGGKKVTETTKVITTAAHTLYAQWEAKTYTVTFDAEGGEVTIASKEVTYDGEYGELPIPTATGFSFAGWYIGDKIITADTKVTIAADHTLQAHWTENEYTIVFNANGGEGTMPTQRVSYTDEVNLTGNTYTRGGYQFIGWSRTENGEKVFNDKQRVTRLASEDNATVILYAVWEKGAYSIVYNLNGGSLPAGADNPEAYDVETANFTLVNPIRTGYTFEGWSGTGIPILSTEVTIIQGSTGNRVYEANWKAIEYGITYNLNDGVLSGEQTNPAIYTIETASFTLENPIRTGYTFEGWSGTALTEPTKIVTITEGSIGAREYEAVWSINRYTITWNNRDGTELEKDENVSYGTMPSYNKADPEKTGDAQYSYTFTGWTPLIKAVTEDQVYTAVYEQTVNKYPVTFYDEDGKVVLKETKLYPYGTLSGEIARPETPSKASDGTYNYEFIGWTPEVATVTTGVDYRATYKATYIKYLVSFKGSTGAILASGYYHSGEMPAVPANPQKASTAQYEYTFAGWNPEVSVVTGNITYTPTYDETIRSYTITWLNDDDTVIDTTEVEYGVTPTHADASKANTAEYTYTFSGWTPEITPVKGEATYQAVFTATKNSYTVVFKNEDGTSLQSTEVPYGETPVYNGGTPTSGSTAEYEYTFAGWTPEIKTVTGPAEYTATYTANKRSYTITWKDDDGTVIDTTIVEYGNTPVQPTIPSKTFTEQTGYAFNGWTPGIVAVTGETTYTATYAEYLREYTILWRDRDGNAIATGENIPYGTVIVDNKPGDPDRESTAQTGYVFTGWYDEAGIKLIGTKLLTGDMEYTAKYDEKIRTYTIIWNNRDGTELHRDEKQPYGTHIGYTGPVPTSGSTEQYSYTHKGWMPEVHNVLGPQVYTAVYESTIRSYPITFYDEDGTTVIEGPTMYKYGTTSGTYKPTTNPTKEGYSFSKWTPDLEPVVGTASYTASYIINSYNITPIKGVGVANIIGGGSYPYNSTVTLTGIAKEGYHFEGGVSEKAFTYTVPSHDTTLQISAEPNKYYIHFNGNGGVGTMEDQEFTYDEEQSLAPNVYTYNGYYFMSWTDGNGGIYKDNSIVKNLATTGVVTLIAQWGDNPGPTPPGPTPTPTPSGGGSGGGGGGKRIDKDTEEHASAEVDTGAIEEIEDKEEKNKSEIRTGTHNLPSKSGTTIKSTDDVQIPATRTQEELDAYKYAHKYGITTLAPKEAARPDEYVQRGHMAKMVVNYALNVLNRKLPTKMPKQCKWKDGRNAWESQEIKEYAEKACALGLMGIDMEYFQPYKLVTRAQFGTIFGRLLWGKLVSKPYYAEHLARLKKRGIMTQIDRPEERIEVRKWAWLMFMRSEKYFKIDK